MGNNPFPRRQSSFQNILIIIMGKQSGEKSWENMGKQSFAQDKQTLPRSRPTSAPAKPDGFKTYPIMQVISTIPTYLGTCFKDMVTGEFIVNLGKWGIVVGGAW